MPPKSVASLNSNNAPGGRGGRSMMKNVNGSNAMANAAKRGAAGHGHRGPGCGGWPMRVLALVLILSAVAAIAYLIYRVIRYGQRVRPGEYDGPDDDAYGGRVKVGGRTLRYSADTTEDDPAEQPYRQSGAEPKTTWAPKKATPEMVGRFYGRRQLYEGYEDAAAEEPGDDYDGKEGRRMEDREKQRQKTSGGGGGSSGTLIYFHMDGCGHCRRFDPVWKDFRERHGQELERAYGLRLESYEAQDPLAQELDISGFPTVVFVDEDGSKRDIFGQQRTVANLRAFAEKNAKKTATKEEEKKKDV